MYRARIRASRAAAAEVELTPSSPGSPYGDAYAPATPSSPHHVAQGPDTPWVGDDPAINKWYHHYQRPGKKGHPYSQAASVLQASGPKRCAQDIRFWPWVGPWTPPEDPMMDWEEWEDTVVISVIDFNQQKGQADGVDRISLLVGKITDEKPWDLLWTLDIEDDLIFRCAWSFDQFTLHPLIICGGSQGIIYIIDAVTKSLVKTLVGHGDEVLSIQVCQAMPHIFATSSTDSTLRIWNIHGAPAPDIPQRVKSENFPMADADEGTECVAVIAGHGYGHRERAIDCAWHPRHNALATCGADHAVKVWALPKLPIAEPDAVTPRGYRPHLVGHPIFSSSRVHTDAVDWIDWLDDDVIASRDSTRLVVWHWTGYKRFFHPHSFDAMSSYAQNTDMSESHSFAHLTSYPVPKANIDKRWYMKPDIHRAFYPEQEEREKFRNYPHLVTSCLIAMPVEASTPALHLFNPSLAEPDPTPPPIKRLRPLTVEGKFESPPNTDTEDEGDQEVDQEVDGVDEQMGGIDIPTDQEGAVVRVEQVLAVPRNEDLLSPIERVKLHPRQSVANNQTALQTAFNRTRPKPREQLKNPSTAPWIISVRDWKNTKKMSVVAQRTFLDKHFFQGCAISPRGAKWIVAIGDCEAVFVFKQKE